MPAIKQKLQPWFVYIILCNDGTLYTGISPDVHKRFELHKAGKGAKYTRSRGAKEIVYYKKFRTKQLAMLREIQIKKLPRVRKLALLKVTDAK